MPSTPPSSDKCPKCTSRNILGPRRVRHDGPLWCHCYKCGRAWHLGKKRKHHRKGCTTWNLKAKLRRSQLNGRP